MQHSAIMTRWKWQSKESSHYSQGRDYEIVRKFESHPKAVPLQIKFEFCVVMGLLV